MISLGNNIKYARKKKGLTQEELATQIGVTPQAVSKWENGTGMPDISMMVPLSQVLSVSTDTLFGLEKTDLDDNIYISIVKRFETIEAEASSKDEAALVECQYLLEQLHENPANFIYECCFVERVANLSRYVDFNKFALDKWPEFRDLAIRYGTHVIRFCSTIEWVERTHYGLAWIYIHERAYSNARDHINALPSIASNRLQESISAQLASFEHGVDGMKEVLRQNLQNFTRAINKEILYAIEDFSWNDDPKYCVEFGNWGMELIHALSNNPDLIPYTRGFTRDIYKYILHADLKNSDYEGAAKHWQELKNEMQRHFDFYQSVLNTGSEMAKYNDRQLRYMQDYTPEFISLKQNEILETLKSWVGDEKYNEFICRL